ncbi:MAG: NUDIX domain-containing protein [Candidatus Aenigmatarchaeota archaeon]
MSNIKPIIAVDAIVIKDGKILLIRRKKHPFSGFWALPGGLVESGETLKEAIKREVHEETGLKAFPEKITGIYDSPKRDPRGHIISVAFLCKAYGKISPQPEEVIDAGFFTLSEIKKIDIAFDHRKIITEALKNIKKPAKVLVGGTFNIIHPGHIYFLERSKGLGSKLVVVVANDKTVIREKGFLLMPAEDRKRVIEKLEMVDKAVIGDERDFMKVVRREKPDIIALGYDQNAKKLKQELKKTGIKPRIVRIKKLKGYKTKKLLNINENQ